MTKKERKEYNKIYYQTNREKLLKQEKEYKKRYYQVNKKEIREKQHKYKQANRGKTREYNKEYYQVNKEEIKNYERWYRQANREKILKYMQEYYQTNKEEIKSRVQRYCQIHREVKRKSENKRRRNLGYIPINNWFEGSNFHHLDRDSGVYIPEWLHKMYSHNVFTGKNMDKMNEAAIRWWMISQCKKMERK